MLSLAMFALAAALIYFAYEVSRVSTQIPDILTSFDHTSDKVGPIISEVGEIRELVPDIVHEIAETRKLVPPILNEVEQARLHIPPILKEVEQTRQQIPPILNEVEAAVLLLLNNGKKGDIRQINNPDSGFYATLKLVSMETKEEDFTMLECRTIIFDAFKNDEKVKTVNKVFCKEEGGGWDLDE